MDAGKVHCGLYANPAGLYICLRFHGISSFGVPSSEMAFDSQCRLLGLGIRVNLLPRNIGIFAEHSKLHWYGRRQL
jgi:hypothetical protein